jgi:subtilisin family serine protease
MMRWAPAALLIALNCGCSGMPVRIGSHALANPPPENSDRFIIAAVDNHARPLMVHAASTPRGYDAIGAYGPSVRARETLHSLELDYGLREVSAWPIEPLHIHCAVLQIPPGAERATLLAALARDTRVRLAQPLQSFSTRTTDYNDPYVGLQRGFQQMDVASAHAWSRGEGVKVAIIDTGADTTHVDLAASIARAENLVDSDAQQYRRDRHGTEVAGVIAAIANNREGIVGVAPRARLLLFKACWQVRADADAADCNSFTLARALAAALDAHAQVINLSLAGPDDPLLSDLIREGVRRGVLFVGAGSSAGPQGNPGLLHQPGVIEVAASEAPTTESSVLHAPGREILTLLPGGHYDFASGDSISTAEVTGVVALLLAKNKSLSASAVYRLLQDTSAPATAGQGSPHVDACAALVALLGEGRCPTAGELHLAAQQDDRGAQH